MKRGIFWGLGLTILAIGLHLFINYKTKPDIPPSHSSPKQSDSGSKLSADSAPIIKGMVFIPAGEFIMGTDLAKEEPLPDSYGFMITPYTDEQPTMRKFLPAFYIDRTEVTIRKYQEFVKATGHPAPAYWSEYESMDKWLSYPVNFVTWDDAVAYAKWRGRRLPTEEEWEKAARGTDGRRYPWGNKYEDDNTNLSDKGVTMAGWILRDRSPFRVLDMAGNLSEWTDSWYKPYPGNQEEIKQFGEKNRVIRGGAWGRGHYNVKKYISRTSYRGFAAPTEALENVGFRCALSVPSTKSNPDNPGIK